MRTAPSRSPSVPGPSEALAVTPRSRAGPLTTSRTPRQTPWWTMGGQKSHP